MLHPAATPWLVVRSVYHQEHCNRCGQLCAKYSGERNMIHYRDVIMSMIASQITCVSIVCSTVYSGADQRNYPCHCPWWGESTGDWWIPLTKGQLCGKCFHLMMSSWDNPGGDFTEGHSQSQRKVINIVSLLEFAIDKSNLCTQQSGTYLWSYPRYFCDSQWGSRKYPE